MAQPTCDCIKAIPAKLCYTCRYIDVQSGELPCANCINGDGWVEEWKPVEANQPESSQIAVPDPVEHPQHYMHGDIETIEIIRSMLTPEEFRGYLKGNILKYRERAPYKGKTDEDYAKAKKYYDWLKEVDAD